MPLWSAISAIAEFIVFDLLLQQVQNAIDAAQRRAQSATKMACDIMHGIFSQQHLASHTVAGGNSSKAALNRDLVRQIIGNTRCFTSLFC